MLARLRHLPNDASSIVLYDHIRDIVKQLIPVATNKHITISMSGAENVIVTSQPQLLSVMLSNIIDNAIKYTPSYGTITINLLKISHNVVIEINDTGPGIPPEKYDYVFQRFSRLLGNEETGSGLGLAIVRHISEALGIKITLDVPGYSYGLCVRLEISG